MIAVCLINKGENDMSNNSVNTQSVQNTPVKRGRGRPKGSKNKPKIQVVATPVVAATATAGTSGS